MSKNTNIADLINYISVDGSGNVVLTTGGQVATQSYVTTAVSNLVNAAPSTLDTLNELAAALGNDANFSTTVTTSIATKQAQLNGTGFVKVSGTTVSYDNSTYLTTTSASSNYLPYTGATTNVNLGVYNLTANQVIAGGAGVNNVATFTTYDGGIATQLIGSTGNLKFFPFWNPSIGARINAENSAGSAYIPLSFYATAIYLNSPTTLTGALSGTSATFSSSVTATGLSLTTSGSTSATITSGGTNVYSSLSFFNTTTGYGYDIGFGGSASIAPNSFYIYGGSTASVKLQINASGAATFSSTITTAALSRIGDVFIGGASGTYAAYADGVFGSNLHLGATGATGAVYINTVLNRNLIINPAGGNVLIGTSTPDAGRLQIQTSGNGLSYSHSFLSMDNSAYKTAFLISHLDGITRLMSTYAGSGINSVLTFWTTESNGNQSERMRILANGNIGIGTLNPLSRLHIGPEGSVGGNSPTIVMSSAAGTKPSMLITEYTARSGAFGYDNSNFLTLATEASVTSGIKLKVGSSFGGGLLNTGIDGIIINTSGQVQRPNQPAFLAYSTGFTVTANGWYNVSNAITTESYDVTSNYSGGRFTAPIAGRYFFYAGGWSSIGTASNGERYAWCARVNDGGLFYIGGGNYCLTDSPLAGYSVVYNLNAGDYVDLWVFSAAGGTWGGGSHSVWWGGYLL